ncbi:DNA-binding protein [Phaeobacter gallaeciensis]|mgnify:CR=1 FL=1|uniref:DNA-binding protein n=1 Tax=Phaeobacter gallaeciensis TaxID=60890 RepID=UPI00237F7A20|nr:DNA-binding protein [Phaeobacter gallaeciensis]MDF1773390.1 DNA-binding protein [Pseudophaeobacter sp. bin_em_oilr2.035]MDE4142342.1 DNA-binding protein [Phaeobacter gallaeciensis]MDE4150787.1 DNA-binding protein [Phaeobacter gallaeciensis]MDE4155016.1 DNA-binding protein [Phaeobacter gallaeciensis]MDE4230406.1 DNA-binding protein [Phaeobacter gallaeciensis]
MTEYHSIEAIADRFQRNPRTIRDWINHGCKTPDGTIRLQAAKLGKSWVVKKEWLEFFEFQIRPRPTLEGLDIDE